MVDVNKILIDIYQLFGLDVGVFLSTRPQQTDSEIEKLNVDLKKEIKKRFHEFALKHHPDKGGPDEELYKKASQAYHNAMEHLKVMRRPPQPPMQVIIHSYSMWSGGATNSTNATTANWNFYGPTFD